MSYHIFVYNGSEPKSVTKVFSNVDSVIDVLIVLKQTMRLHFLDVYVNYQIQKGNK